MTVEDLKKMINPFPEFEVIYQEDPQDRVETYGDAVYITLRHKESHLPVYMEKSSYYTTPEHPTVKRGYAKFKTKEGAINDCCLKIMHNLIAVGLYEQYKITKELRKTHGY